MSAKEKLPLALRAAYLALHRQSNASFARYGATADQFVLLATLARGQSLTQRDLARRMPSDPSTVRVMLALLAKRGWVQRDAHPTDTRARTASLTPAGKRKFRQLWAAGESIRSQMLDGLGQREAESLIELLDRVAESLSREGEPVVAKSSRHSSQE